MILAGLFAGLLAVSAWISIPVGSIAVTMQTFTLFLCLEVLGGKWGTVSILVYLLLGCTGVPVFSGFQGGIGALAGATGGYLWGFLLSGLAYWSLEKLCRPAAAWVGLLLCYFCGSVWFSVYSGRAGLWAAAATCVLPYLIPDLLKLQIAKAVSRRLKPNIRSA